MTRAEKYGFRVHADAMARTRSAVNLVKLLLRNDAEILPAHREECLNIALWKITEAEAKHKHRTRFSSEAALTAAKGELRHDHVFQRAIMVKELMNCPLHKIDDVLGKAVACTITKEEHLLLNQHRQLDGWERYASANVTVIDNRTGEKLALGDANKLLAEKK
jgi:hypothetical protein